MLSQTAVEGFTDPTTAVDQEYSAEEISAYYLELEQVLDRIERAVNHYQVLDLDRLATTGEIKLAYLRAVALLNPSQLGINVDVPDSLLARIDPSFDRVSRAYSTLVNFARRLEYDTSLSGRGTSPLTFDKQQRRNSKEVTSPLAMAALRAAQTAKQKTAVKKEPNFDAALSSAAKNGASDNRRRCERFRLSVPVHVTGYDRKGGRWHEATRTVDVSRTGAQLNLRKRIKKGTVLYLTMPLPVRLRTRDFQDPTYVSYALVRRVDTPKGHVTGIGLEFLGPHPPDGYLERPWDVFQSEQWSGGERRRAPREEKSEPVLVEYFTESMDCIKQEAAVTENVSRRGFLKGVLATGGLVIAANFVPARAALAAYATMREA